MTPLRLSMAGSALLCVGAVAAWVFHLFNTPVPDPLLESQHASTARVSAQPCDETTGEGYISSGRWSLDEYGPVLELTPTECGRHAGIAKRDHLDIEVVEKFSGNLQWRNTRGLINQLDCHAIRYPDKPTWNVEPDRPYVGYERTWQADCNPHEPLPDASFE